MGFTATITSKGQVTIPKKIRKLIKTNIVEFYIEKNGIMLKPIKNVGASLVGYSKGNSNFEDIRKQVWKKVIDERK